MLSRVEDKYGEDIKFYLSSTGINPVESEWEDLLGIENVESQKIIKNHVENKLLPKVLSEINAITCDYNGIEGEEAVRAKYDENYAHIKKRINEIEEEFGKLCITHPQVEKAIEAKMDQNSNLANQADKESVEKKSSWGTVVQAKEKEFQKQEEDEKKLQEEEINKSIESRKKSSETKDLSEKKSKFSNEIGRAIPMLTEYLAKGDSELKLKFARALIKELEEGKTIDPNKENTFSDYVNKCIAEAERKSHVNRPVWKFGGELSRLSKAVDRIMLLKPEVATLLASHGIHKEVKSGDNKFADHISMAVQDIESYKTIENPKPGSAKARFADKLIEELKNHKGTYPEFKEYVTQCVKKLVKEDSSLKNWDLGKPLASDLYKAVEKAKVNDPSKAALFQNK